jgi:acetyl-CoA carboxylase carboxyl transferase subunit alpha
MISYLEFEKPVAALEARIAELKAASEGDEVDISAELKRLEAKSADLLASTYAALTPWQKTLVARHAMRPHFSDYVELMFDEFVPLGGDRLFGEDEAILGGFATFRGRRVMLIGHEKGKDTQSRIKHNFGMGKPEGYRKAIRLMDMAGRFGLPVVTLVDTSGAFPGVEAEERGQAEAIARSTEACLALPTPMVATIVGEGGSGGAVARAPPERVLMLEHAGY